MQWGAPAGVATTMAYSVSITPNVNGEVTEVPVETDKPVKQGDVLFKIDPTLYQATLDGLIAKLMLAETRLKQSQELAKQKAGSIYELQAYQAEVDGLNAQIASADPGPLAGGGSGAGRRPAGGIARPRARRRREPGGLAPLPVPLRARRAIGIAAPRPRSRRPQPTYPSVDSEGSAPAARNGPGRGAGAASCGRGAPRRSGTASHLAG